METKQTPATGGKKKKKKGPIRFEAIIPFTIVVALVVLYFTLFFDGHLKSGTEWLGSRLNGAEVNVGSLRTSFWKASLQVRKIEVTDKAKPEQNRVEIENVGFAVLWDALLRGKAVINEATVTGIQVGTPRKRPGRVYPVESESRAAAFLRSKISGTVLGDIARMLEGFDPAKELKELGNLKSVERVEQLRNDLVAKEKAWSATLASLPGENDLASLRQRLGSIQISGGNPAQIQGQIQQLNGLIGEMDQKANAVQNQGNALLGDVTAFGGSVGEIDNLVKQDTQDLEGRIKLPKLDAKSLAKDLFGPKIVSQVAQVERYITLARQAMPPKTAKGQAAPVAHPRGKGKLYQFGRPNSYPLFWLKKAEITSRLENTPFGGNVSGQLLDLTSSQAQLGRPTELRLTGDFPKRGFMGIKFLANLDHRTEVPVETIQLSAASFPVERQELSTSEDIGFAIVKAVGSAGIEGVLKGDGVELKLQSAFREVDYQISSKSKLLESTLQSIVKGVPTVNMQAALNGTWSELALSVESNLASALEQGFQKQLQARIAEARARIQTMVRERVDKQKAELTAQYQALRDKFGGQVEARKKQVQDLRAQADGKLADAKKQLAPKGLEGIRKKLPF